MFRSRQKSVISPRGRAVVLFCVAIMALDLGIGASIRIAHAQEGAHVVTVKEVFTLKQAMAIFCVAFSPDGKRIVTGSHDHTAKVWEVQTGRVILTLRGHSSAINSVAYSPDGKHIVTSSEDDTVKLWNARTGQEILTFKGHTHRVRSVAFSPDGKHIVTGSWDNTATVWLLTKSQ